MNKPTVGHLESGILFSAKKKLVTKPWIETEEP